MKKLITAVLVLIIATSNIFPADYFWVGGTGNWSDFANHWATSSGGAIFHATAPTSNDIVYFDANSFNSPGETVTVDVEAYCHDMNWTGATYDPVFTGSSNLHCTGSFTLIPNMTYSYSGYLYFESISTGETIASEGHQYSGRIYFDGLGGWVFQDDFDAGVYTRIYFLNGSINTNNYNFIANRITSTVTTPRTLTLGSSVLTLHYGSTSALQINGTNFTLNAGTSLIKLINNSGGINVSGTGNLNFNNVLAESITGTNYIYSNGGSFNVITFNNSGYLSYNHDIDSLLVANVLIVNNNHNINFVEVMGTAGINGNSSYGEAIFHDHTTFTGDNDFNTLELFPGKSYTVNAGKTQTIGLDLIANGSCSEPITLQSSSATIQSSISKSSGIITVTYCILKSQNATGGATFYANNTVDLGNNSGWVINPPAPQNLYWIGGTGDWDDPNHWSTSSGGAGGACIPSPIDNVFFDANSFSSPGQTVTAIGDGSNNVNCKSMDWSTVTNNPTFTGISALFLNIYGSLYLSANMTYTYAGKIYFLSDNPGNIITSQGQVLNYNDIYFDKAGGGWSLMGDLNMGDENIYLNHGDFNTSGYNITAQKILSQTSNVRSLTLGSSVIILNHTNNSALRLTKTNLTFDCGTSLIKFPNPGGGMYCDGTGTIDFHNIICEAATGTSYISNGGGSFNTILLGANGSCNNGLTADSIWVTLNGTFSGNDNNINYLEINEVGVINNNGIYNELILKGNGSFTGENTISTLELTPGNSYTFNYGKTQTITSDLIANGTCTAPIVFQTNNALLQSTLSKATGTVTVNYAILQNMNAEGGATFTANNTIDMGNNTGWTIIPPAPLNLYWVGGTGNWNDPNNWSFTSGGSGGACIPTSIDNVFFDANSFSASGQTVTLIGDGSNNVNCNSMDWNDVTNNPTLAGATTLLLRIYGSLILDPNMTFSFGGKIYFNSTNTGNLVQTEEHILNFHDMYFDGIGGEWSLMDPIDIGDENFYLVNGSIITNNHNITCRRFLSQYSTVRSLDLGSSELILNYSSYGALIMIGTNFTLNATNSTTRLISPGGGINISGTGALVLNNVMCEAATGTSTISNDYGVINNIAFNSNGVVNGYVTADSIVSAGNLSIYDNNNINYILCNGEMTIYGVSSFGKMILNGNGTITNHNTYDTLELTAGNAYTFSWGKQQTFNNELIANGTPTELIVIQSNVAGNQTTFSKSSGSVLVNYVSLQDNNAIGGASFIANNSLDLGNNFGWTITSGGGTDYFWVGGTGNYNDPAHWASVSGGAGGAGIPSILDNVYFDANSFTATGQTVTIVGDASGHANCKDMDWTGSLFNPTLAGLSSQTMNIYGSLNFISEMTFSFIGPIVFASTSTGNTITTNGIEFTNNHLYFDGIGGGWTLNDDLSLPNKYLYFYNGSLNTNNNDISLYRFYSNEMNTRGLSLGSSVITANYNGQAFTLANNGLTLNAGTSLIKFTGINGGMSITGGSPVAFYDVLCENTGGTSNISNDYGSFRKITFNNNGRLYDLMTADSVIFNSDGTIYGNLTADYVEVNGTGNFSSSSIIEEAICFNNASFNGSNTFGTLELTPGKIYTLAYNHIQTINNDLIANGTCTAPISLESNSSGNSSTISKSSGTITVNRVQLLDQNAIGGATFVANNSVDLGNNTGWTINPVVPQDLFWVGGTGNWNDVSHWAAFSGGPGGYCLPTAFDNVYFDANSFYQENQGVYIDVADVSCANMDWSAASFVPTFSMLSNTYSLHINGSLTLNPAMNFTISGIIYFESPAKSKVKASNTITMAGQAFVNNIYFNGDGQEWILQDEFNIANKTIFFEQGILNTNDQTVHCNYFKSLSSSTRSLLLGSSTINVYAANYSAWQVNSTLFGMDAGTSEIRILSSNAGLNSPYGSTSILYNKVSFISPSGKAIVNSDNEFNDVEFFGNGEVKGNGTFNKVTFHFDATINGTNTFGNVYMHANGFLNGSNTYSLLFFTPGYTYTLQAGYWQTILFKLFSIGTCADQINIVSSIPGTQAVFYQSSGNFIINFVNLQDNEGMGGATFLAYNSVDLGNNTGWTIFPEGPKDIYWVGNGGDWLDISHWSFSSGGPGNYCIPGPEDNVIFDENSFTEDNQIVLIDDPAVEFNSMTWTGVTNMPTIIGYASYFEMYINGSLTLDPDMNFDFEGELFFQGGGAKDKGSYTLRSWGHQFNNDLHFDGAGQEWTLLDPLNLWGSDLDFVSGTLNTNDQTVSCKRFYSFYTNIRTLDLGTSTIHVNDDMAFGWDVNGTNMTLYAGTATINLLSYDGGFRSVFGNPLVYQNVIAYQSTGSSMIYTDHQITALELYNDAEITGGGTFWTTTFYKNGEINSSNTFNNLYLEPGYEYVFESGQTQNISSNIYMSANACNPIYIHSSISGSQAYVHKISSMVGLYLYVQDMNATGGSINCNVSHDLGNNTNWNFNAGAGKDFYFTTNLEGAWNGSDMNTDLIPYIPNDHPYNNAPWNYGTCQVAPILPADMVDWVLIELRDAPTAAQALPATAVAQKAGFLLADGSIVSGDGSSPLRIDVTPVNNLYAVIYHRNHSPIMSSISLANGAGYYTYDFTNMESAVYGGSNGHKLLTTGVWGMFAGDANTDGDINQTDMNTTWSSEVGGVGYLQSDLNLQGQSDNVDKNDVWLPNDGEGSQVPD